jgi:hypothetical protein
LDILGQAADVEVQQPAIPVGILLKEQSADLQLRLRAAIGLRKCVGDVGVGFWS